MKRIYLLLVVVLVASCGNPQDLKFQEVKNFQIKEMSMNPEVTMDIQFYNPNKFGMTMKEGEVDLFLNGNQVGHATLIETYNVPANDTFLLPVSLKADMAKVIPNAIAIITTSKLEVEVKGYVRAGKGVFVKIPLHYKGEQKLN